MKLLLATAFLILMVAEAHHTPEHTLRGPRFAIEKVQVYEVELNVTSGVQGLSSQVSKSAFKAELHVYAKTEKEHILKITKVYTSGSVKAVENKNADVPMHKNRELESRLSTPIKFTLDNGQVTSYTLSPRESLESKKIKKAILRSLEMHVPETALQQMESSKQSLRIPVIYNTTRNTGWSQQTTFYMITVSPDVDFPYSNMVYNISRTEHFEGESYHSHHNFQQRSCTSSCSREWKNPKHGASCPPGYKENQSPVKTYVQHNYNLVLEEGIMTPEIIKTVEVHDAKMYDQDMKVLIRQSIRKIGYSRNVMEDPINQSIYTNLEDQEVEIDEEKINDKCDFGNPIEATESAKTLLNEITMVVLRGDLEMTESTTVGEKIILLKKALSKLKASDLKELANEITPKGSLKAAEEEEKVKRQIWMDILPLIGTNESVSFIVSYIKEGIGKEMLIWEAKELLEALPYNIRLPDEKMLSELRTLLSLPEIEKSHLFHSAAHSCLVKTIRFLCDGKELGFSNGKPAQRSSSFESNQSSHGHLHQISSSSSHSRPECPVSLATEIVQDIIHKLSATKKEDEIIIYLDALSQSGAPEVLPVISEYAYGAAENLQGLSPSYIEFVKSAAIYSLHSVAGSLSEDVFPIVTPLFFNETETSRIRTAAFGVLIRSQPPLEVLQNVASHSWSERSNEVGSFVTSTLETYGNSSLPCMQLTARRIKQVIPLIKRFDIGVQHAKNLLWSYFDDVRNFGLRNHLTYTPSNASIIPSALYHAFSYSTDNLVDTLIEGALNAQGLTQEKIFQYIDQHILGMSPVETIPSAKEKEIFEEAKIVEHIPETLRFTLYKRMFYCSSFYYLDWNNMKAQVDTLKEYLGTYLTKPSSEYSGHLVKILLPSSYHSVTIGKSLPYPVEFQMHHPMLMALKIESEEKYPSLSNLHFLVKPSVYITRLLTHQVKNIGDCKEVGVYHEHKLAISYPVEVKLQVQGLMNATVHYRLPELPKKVLYYFTESGTYAERNHWEILPSSEDRQPIRTLPSPLKNSTVIRIIGLPPIHVERHTEDISLLAEELPNNPWEVLDFTVKKILNAGWRYKSVNISLEENPRAWPKDTEVTCSIQHSRSHVAKGNLRMSRQQNPSTWSRIENENVFGNSEWVSMEQEHEKWTTQNPAPETPTESESEEDNMEASPLQWFWNKNRKEKYEDENWTEEFKSSDIPRNRNPSTFANQGKRMSSILSNSLSHIAHVFNFNIETRPVYSFANIKVEYNQTHSKSLHAIHMDATMKAPNQRTVKQMSMDHVMGFSQKPDEFQYHTHSDDQTALFITALRTHNVGCSCPWKNVEIIAKGVLEYESLDDILNNELEDNIERKFFLSKHHDQCVEDIENGHAQSSSCVKAIKERSIYNKLRMSVLWTKYTPERVKNIARRFDVFLKHVFYRHMSIDYRPNFENRIHVSLNHIDKLTEKPLFDVNIKVPEETVTFRRMRAVGLALSSVYDLLDLDIMKLTNDTYPPTCVMMKKSVRTYDLKYYPLSLDGCSYVLSTHCTQSKNFAIITKILSTDGTKELHIYIGLHTLILSPMTGNHYTIKYDNQEYTISEPFIFDENTAEIYVFSEKYASGHRHLEIVARKAGVRVLYDGKNVKIQIHPRYKGQTCGLCSEFDGETAREFTGVDKCLYSHPSDFVNSAILTNKETCRKQASHPYICDGENVIWSQGGNTAKYEPNIKRNIITVKGNNICFSVRPVPVCDLHSLPTETETLQIGFHCLPKEDITAKRMISEAKRRSLGEIENKSIDYEENIEVAKMC